MLVCLDTQIMIWGIKEQATQGQEGMITKTKRFLADCDQKGIGMLIPSVVVAELLIRVPAELHPMVLNLFQKSFIVPSFDLQAAAHYARIWQTRTEDHVIREFINSGIPKRQLKADSMIVATAVANHADCLYSHDGDVRVFAEGFIEVREIPDIMDQIALFE